MKRSNKTIIIGLDALPWTYLNPLLKRGTVPNLASLISRGCKGMLNSTIPPTSPVAWSSFMTGVNPQKHKIFDFVGIEAGTYRTHNTNGRDRREVGFWRYLNNNGMRCGICNLALSFPAEKVDGFFISGFDSPSDSPKITFPQEIYHELRAKLGRNPFTYPNFMMPNQNRKRHIERYLKQCLEREDLQTEIVLDLAEKYDVDVLVVNYMAIDHFNHYLDDIEYVYKAIERLDYNIGKFINKYPDANFLIISDHGSQRLNRVLLAYEWLRDMRYIVFDNKKYQVKRINAVLAHLLQNRWGIQGYAEKLARKSISFLFLFIPSVIRNELMNLAIGENSVILWPHSILDFGQSVVCSFQPGINGFRINLKGREPRGIVDPGDYHNVRQEIIKKLTSLKNPITDEALFQKVYRREELCSDIDENMLPDIIGISNETARCKLVANLVVRSDPMSYPFVVSCEEAKYFGEHTIEGIYIFSGPAFKQSDEGDAYHLIDIPALTLYLHDVPIPSSFDGRVPLEVIVEGLRKRHIECQRTIAAQQSGLKSTLDEKGKKAVEERLKGLGYL